MLILGIILLILGAVFDISVLYVVGGILAIIGLVLLVVPSIGGGRRFY